MQIKPLVFIACVMLSVAYIFHSGMGSDPLVRKGSKAPDFTLKTLDGKEVSLSDFRGSVVFLNFWRTDCPPCVAEMRDMELVQKVFKGRKFQMMPVSLDMDTSDVAAFYREKGLTMPAYLDPGQNVSDLYKVAATPETFLIGSDGTVAKFYIGQQPWASPEVLAQLESMIPSAESSRLSWAR
jgi:peroxiredoxin